ncbi:hypothetical protein M9Y10_012479 [Tritrichomonas musculus]|uniref:GOLD domain-containing protein n=1 Tax=Tritrichomonas musculus TaxID=1915356 RepID=A0ABR2IE89_9EUKA
MFDENTEDFKLMNKFEIPLRDHPYKTHYIFNDDIAMKKKDAGQLHFELDFEPIEEESSETLKEGENVNYNVQFTNSKIKLLTNSISHVFLDIYEKDFVFIVNEQPFETRRIVSNLISPTVLKLRLIILGIILIMLYISVQLNFMDISFNILTKYSII